MGPLARLTSGIPRSICGLACGTLHLACVLLGISRHLFGRVAGDFAGGFFDGTFDLSLNAFGAVLVHFSLQLGRDVELYWFINPDTVDPK
jgi:hypothetical protein